VNRFGKHHDRDRNFFYRSKHFLRYKVSDRPPLKSNPRCQSWSLQITMEENSYFFALSDSEGGKWIYTASDCSWELACPPAISNKSSKKYFFGICVKFNF